MSYISIQNIEKSFGKNRVLKNINIEIEKGEFISLLGPSGCGKTTLLRIISGLEEQNSGKIFVDNNDISKLNPSQRGIGIVFQNYVLFPNLTVFENVAYGLVSRKESKIEISKKVKSVLDKVDLYHIKDKYPSQLSGGQQQRVALARALVLSPKILLLDEPLSALDAKVRESLRRELKRIQRELNITTIMVTHDQEEALTMSDKLVVFNNGMVAQAGTPEEIYNYPKDDFIAEFIGVINILEDGENIKRFRPEEVKLSNKEIEGYKKAEIVDIEFRGAFYRITLKDNLNFIIVDILSSTKDNTNIELNSTIYYEVN